MSKIIREDKFEKDVKILNKKHYNFSKFYQLVDLFTNDKAIHGKYQDHPLKGNLQGYRECHLDDNILVIYQIVNDTVCFCRIGNHKDLLNK